MTEFRHRRCHTMTKLRLRNKKVTTEFRHKTMPEDGNIPSEKHKGDDCLPHQEIPDDDEIRSEDLEDDAPIPPNCTVHTSTFACSRRPERCSYLTRRSTNSRFLSVACLRRHNLSIVSSTQAQSRILSEKASSRQNG